MEKLKDCQLQHVTPEEVGVKSSAVAAFINEINEKHLGLRHFGRAGYCAPAQNRTH